MRNILCFGDSNTWGCKPITKFGFTDRYGPEERWPGVLQSELGDGYKIIEEGLNGRTTVYDDPVAGADRNGKSIFSPILETHMPLDLVIIMLGTNDMKPRFAGTAFDVACGAGALLSMVMNPIAGWLGDVPKTLLIAPPELGKLSVLDGIFEDGHTKSKKLASEMEKIADMLGSPFLNAGDYIRTSAADGVHLELDAHQALGLVIAEKVNEILV